MEFKISGLKCDFCTYRDDEVQFSEYEASIGRPCPHCGHSLLTREDYDLCVKQYKLIARLEKIGNVLKWLNPFHYWRLIFGDNRPEVNMSIRYINKNLQTPPDVNQD
jgi:hypothetical protein